MNHIETGPFVPELTEAPSGFRAVGSRLATAGRERDCEHHPY